MNEEKLIYDFFMWFRHNGEYYVNISIEEMINYYLKQKK